MTVSWRSAPYKFEIISQTNGQVGGLNTRFQVLEKKLDAKTSSVQSGTGRLPENRGMKGKSPKKGKLRSQGIRSKNVKLPGAGATQNRGDVAVAVRTKYISRIRSPADRFIFIDGRHNRGISSF